MRRTMLLLDVNGTVLDDGIAAHEAAMAVLTAFGVPRTSNATYIEEIVRDGNYYDFYRRRGITGSDADNDEIYRIFIDGYHAHAPEIVLMDGVHDALERLHMGGVSVHVVSAARESFVRPILNEARILELCESEHYDVHDKAACAVRLVRQYAIEPSHCALAGDLPTDVQHAKAAGIRGIGFANEHVPRELFRDVRAMDYFVFDHQALADYMLHGL